MSSTAIKLDHPRVVSPGEWLRARKEFLAKEKEFTRQRDALNTERRKLPMVEIDKGYIFRGPDGQATFWLGPPTGTEARELHVAFKAPDRAAVDAVHEAAVAAGVEVLHAPREFPEYHPGYYGVFLRDLDGHNVEAVHHGQPG